MMGLEEKLLTVRLLCAIEFDIFLMWKDEAFARLLVEMTHFCVVYYGFSNPQNFCLFSILISYSQCYVLSFHLIIRSLSILLFHIRFLSSLFVLYFKFQSMVFFRAHRGLFQIEIHQIVCSIFTCPFFFSIRLRVLFYMFFIHSMLITLHQTKKNSVSLCLSNQFQISICIFLCIFYQF